MTRALGVPQFSCLHAIPEAELMHSAAMWGLVAVLVLAWDYDTGTRQMLTLLHNLTGRQWGCEVQSFIAVCGLLQRSKFGMQGCVRALAAKKQAAQDCDIAYLSCKASRTLCWKHDHHESFDAMQDKNG